MISESRWKVVHKFQKKPGWCGPAVIQMILSSCGIRKTQKTIAKAVYKEWWGTNQQMMLAYLSRYFKIVNYKHNANTTDIAEHLDKGHIVVVDWMDDFGEGEAGGHYSIVSSYDSKAKILSLVDSSNARPGIWKIAAKDFNPRWYDTLDVHDRTWVDGWMLWVDPSSKL
jgi:hypothetical protein